MNNKGKLFSTQKKNPNTVNIVYSDVTFLFTFCTSVDKSLWVYVSDSILECCHYERKTCVIIISGHNAVTFMHKVSDGEKGVAF